MSKTLKSRRRMAALILKCGESRVWIDPSQVSKVRQAITRKDIRGAIKEGRIKKLKAEVQYSSHGIHDRRKQRQGSRKGSFNARAGKKTSWLKIVRPQRALLMSMRAQGNLKEGSYRNVYRKIKGNFFRSKAHLTSYLKDNDMLEGKSDVKSKQTV